MRSHRLLALLPLVPVCAAPLTAQAAVDAAAAGEFAPIATVHCPVLPEAITSFGACDSAGWAWVYGGHTGRAHEHSRDNVTGAFHRLNLADGTSWQSLPAGPALQGTALVAASDGGLWRIGGMTAHNARGERDDLHSTASVARFDPVRGTWAEATPLPEARSSHDAAVVGDVVYVFGGWTLAGGDEGTWLGTAWSADLRADPVVWQPVPAPVHTRRAAATATLDGRLVLLGGIGPDGFVTANEVYDPRTRTWSSAPALPGNTFGAAARELRGRLVASVDDGGLFTWDGHGEWRRIGQLETPRFFHRFVAAGDDRLLALGGASRGGHTHACEPVSLEPDARFELREYAIPAPGRVATRQGLLLAGNVLWAFGGNRRLPGDRFAAGQFADDVWRIDLLSRTAARSGALPVGTQSLAATGIGDRSDGLLVGGLTTREGAAESSAIAYRWNGRRGGLETLAELPERRTQCEVVAIGNRVLVLGGVDFTPDDGGGRSDGNPCDVFECDLVAKPASFARSSIRLPRPRRSFGAAVLDGQLMLVGGLGHDFEHAGPVDVLDVERGTWSELTAPVAWVSPQVATIGDRLYVACGGTMRGQRFTEDRTLWSWSRREGWRVVVPSLPFAVRDVQMLALRNRLLFYTAAEAPAGRIVLRTLLPDAACSVPESAMAH